LYHSWKTGTTKRNNQVQNLGLPRLVLFNDLVSMTV